VWPVCLKCVRLDMRFTCDKGVRGGGGGGGVNGLRDGNLGFTEAHTAGKRTGRVLEYGTGRLTG